MGLAAGELQKLRFSIKRHPTGDRMRAQKEMLY